VNARTNRRNLLGVFGVIILAAVPAGIYNTPVLLTLITIAIYFAIISSNWNLLLGFGGIWSFGQLGFFAIGAYSSALLTLAGYSPWLAMVVGVGISVLGSLGLSLITLRLRQIYFALATFGFQQVLLGFIIMIHPGEIFDIPNLKILGLNFGDYNGIPYYYTFLILLLGSLLAHKRVLSSRIGLALTALRDSELRSISLGVRPVRVRSIVFSMSAALTSLAGSVYAHYTTSVSQATLGFTNFLTFTIILAFGGIGTFYGPVVASFLINFIDFPLRLYVGEYRLVVLGIMVMLSLLFLNRGLTQIYDTIRDMIQRRSRAVVPPKSPENLR
jgi:branched-chain amino acid transport system permease protein